MSNSKTKPSDGELLPWPKVRRLEDVKIVDLPSALTNAVNTAIPSVNSVNAQTLPAGFTPYSFSEFVIKIYERCNLACSYCYMYEMADQTWRDRPVKMSAETFEKLSFRIGEHVAAYELSNIEIVFHGGEPLLRGREFLKFAATLLHSKLKDIHVKIRVQTNASTLNREMMDVLREHDIFVGVSLDGPRVANDRHRLDSKGNSSFDATMAGLSLLTQSDSVHLFRGIYSTVDTRNDPIETYEFLQSLGPPMIDFFLPHGNWETPPPFHGGDSATPYSDWLIPIFDRWYSTPKQMMSIRIFDSILNGLLGGFSEVETIGLSPVRSVFIDTDGSINQVDTLKSAFSGATDTGFTIFQNSFNEAMYHPEVIARQVGKAALSDICNDCEIVSVCGGGYYPHRYHPETKFDNPSVYCADLMALIRHIREQVQSHLTKLQMHKGRLQEHWSDS